MVCGVPFSVTLKSSALSPSMVLPFLSVTVTVSITNWELMENLAMLPSCVAAAGGVWAGCCAVAAISQVKRAAVIFRIGLEPHPHGCLHRAHLVGRGRQTELRTIDIGNPARIRHVVEHVL